MKIWRNKHGDLFHDSCFEVGESRDGYTLVERLDELDEDDFCEACSIEFLASSSDDDDDEDEDDVTQSPASDVEDD